MQTRHTSGYSLIELIIVISIIAALFTGGYTAYREYSRRQVLANDTSTLRSNFNFARQKALSGEKPSGCTTLTGYRVSRTSTIRYRTYAVCSPDILVSTYDLTTGVTISDFNILFEVLGQGTAGSDTTITITHSTTGGNEQIIVTSQGTVK